MKKSTLKISLFGILAAVAITLSFFESLVPITPFLPPGAKLGLSNIATMFVSASMGFIPAMLLTFIKAFFAGITRGATSFFMSLCGGILSTGAMYLLFRYTKKVGFIGIGIISAIMHNLGQLIVATIMIGSSAAIGYAPFLIVFGVVSGILTGIVLKAIMPHMLNIIKGKGGE
ncbi:MAG: Gx transporter family protein [Oscillospiraceae bacterium]